MKYCILMGSPRKNGNTNDILIPFADELSKGGAEIKTYWLYEMDIMPCIACRNCQKDWDGFGCIMEDDLNGIFDEILASDVIVLATPIYSWFCTPPMKALLDRLVYGMNKYYGETIGPSLWEGKYMGSIVTCGYPPERGADLFLEALKRYCKHSKLKWLDMYSERHRNYKTPFMDNDKEKRAREFAKKISGMIV